MKNDKKKKIMKKQDINVFKQIYYSWLFYDIRERNSSNGLIHRDQMSRKAGYVAVVAPDI